jgi:hypothetical protein
MMARFCSFMWRIDDTIRHLGFSLLFVGSRRGEV